MKIVFLQITFNNHLYKLVTVGVSDRDQQNTFTLNTHIFYFILKIYYFQIVNLITPEVSPGTGLSSMGNRCHIGFSQCYNYVM